VLGPDAATLLEGVVLASIGPSTTATAERLGLAVTVAASEHTSAGLVDALTNHYAALRGDEPLASEVP
jgi:uroporphyrinogen III methyltransferase/synthase